MKMTCESDLMKMADESHRKIKGMRRRRRRRRRRRSQLCSHLVMARVCVCVYMLL